LDARIYPICDIKTTSSSLRSLPFRVDLHQGQRGRRKENGKPGEMRG
jgi:hypothetical protein